MRRSLGNILLWGRLTVRLLHMLLLLLLLLMLQRLRSLPGLPVSAMTVLRRLFELLLERSRIELFEVEVWRSQPCQTLFGLELVDRAETCLSSADGTTQSLPTTNSILTSVQVGVHVECQ